MFSLQWGILYWGGWRKLLNHGLCEVRMASSAFLKVNGELFVGQFEIIQCTHQSFN